MLQLCCTYVCTPHAACGWSAAAWLHCFCQPPQHLSAASQQQTTMLTIILLSVTSCCLHLVQQAHLEQLLIQIQEGTLPMLCPARQCIYLILVLPKQVACCCAALCCCCGCSTAALELSCGVCELLAVCCGVFLQAGYFEANLRPACSSMTCLRTYKPSV